MRAHHEPTAGHRRSVPAAVPPVRSCAPLSALLITVALLLSMVLPAGENARAQTLAEAQLRARFVLHFLRFTGWPDRTFPSADAPVVLCVLGVGDPLESSLAELQGASVGGHKIDVRGHVDVEQAGECHALYVPDNELRRLAGARKSIGKHPALIVGESEAVLDRGGMIAMRAEDRHLSFVVNLGPARRAALEFSPQMLHAAAEVLP